MRNGVRLISLLCLFAAFSLAAETVFEIIELRYRMADELLPVLRPLVEPEGTISSTQNKLIVRAPRENMRELRKLVSQLDTVPRQLLVTVHQGGSSDSTTRAVGVAGKGKFGDATVDVPSSVDPSLPGIGVAGSKGGVELRGGQRDTHASNNGDQQLRVMDGREAVIYVGQAVPYTTKSVGPGGSVTVNTQLREVLTGFVVRPRLQGDQVTLDVSPQQESLDEGQGGAINVSRLSTSITGRLGEWIDLGAVTQQTTTENRRNFSRSTTDSESSQQVLIKVEVLP
jgi:type II secretory pathway component GspD/PulD (secretin)